MLLLLNTTKTMNPDASVPSCLKVTKPRKLKAARLLADKIAGMSCSQLADLMSLGEKLADKTKANADLWGVGDRPGVPALFGFTGLLYKSLDAAQNYQIPKLSALFFCKEIKRVGFDMFVEREPS